MPSEERNRLTDLEVAEVSLVGKPANKRSFLVFKSEEGGKEMPDINEKILEILQEELPENIMQQLENEELEELEEEELEALQSAVKLLRAYKKELPENVLETLAELAELELPENEEEEEIQGQNDEEKVKATKGLRSYPEPVKKADGSFDLSGVPKEQRAIIEALWKQSERSELLEKQLKDEVDQRMVKQYIEKAQSYSHLPIKASEFGPVLKTIAERSPKEFEKVEGLLKAVNEALGQSALYREIGSNHQGASNAWDKVEQLATGLIQKNADMTKEQAITKVLEENPALYSEYLAEKR